MKYVKLNKDHTELSSGIFFQKPKQIARFDDSEIHKYNWFTVQEIIPSIDNPEYYRTKQKAWELQDNRVVFTYTHELKEQEVLATIITDKINTLRDEKLLLPITFQEHIFDREPKTLQRISDAVVLVLADNTYETDWITDDNQIIHLTGDDIIRLGKAQTKYESEVVFHARELKNKIIESENPIELDINSDWPSTEL